MSAKQMNAVIAARLESDFRIERARGLRIAAIVDPASHPSAWASFGNLAVTRGGVNLFKATRQPLDERVAPLLLPLHENDDDTLVAPRQGRSDRASRRMGVHIGS